MSSILIFSICLAREVAWRAFDSLAEKRRTKFCRSATRLLGLGVGRRLPLARLGRGFHEVVVVARIDRDLAVVQVGHVGADLVQEVAVVGDDDHGALALVDHVLQPADGVDVEVVGRLVEQQDVGIGEQRLAPAARAASSPAPLRASGRCAVRWGCRRRAAVRRRALRPCSRRIRRSGAPVRPRACSRLRSPPGWRRSRPSPACRPTSARGPSSPRRARASSS